MKFICSFLILLLEMIEPRNVSAQHLKTASKLGGKEITYKVLILMTSTDSLRGSIYSTGDSSVVIAKTRTWFYPGTTPTETISVEKIWRITARKRGNVSSGMLIGALVGALVGGVVGYERYKPCDYKNKGIGACWFTGRGFSAFGGVMLGVPTGGAIGGIVGGSIKKNFTIRGKRDSYAAQREKLKLLSITGQ